MSEINREALMRAYRKAHRDWPSFIIDSGPAAERAWFSLSDEEREAGVAGMDRYVQACKAGSMRLCSFGIYLKERRWQRVPEVSADAPKMLKLDVAPFGPIWASLRMLALLAGPVPVELPGNVRDIVRATHASMPAGKVAGYLRGRGITLDADGGLVFPEGFEREELRRRIQAVGYPEVNRLHEMARLRTRSSAPTHLYGLQALCEPVPVDGDAFWRWAEHERRMGWPAMPDHGAMPVIWYPAGGPEGLAAFEVLARAIMTGRQGNDDAA